MVTILCREKWTVQLMSWSDYRDALIRQQGLAWETLLSYKLVLGGRDISNDMMYTFSPTSSSYLTFVWQWLWRHRHWPLQLETVYYWSGWASQARCHNVATGNWLVALWPQTILTYIAYSSLQWSQDDYASHCAYHFKGGGCSTSSDRSLGHQAGVFLWRPPHYPPAKWFLYPKLWKNVGKDCWGVSISTCWLEAPFFCNTSFLWPIRKGRSSLLHPQWESQVLCSYPAQLWLGSIKQWDLCHGIAWVLAFESPNVSLNWIN